MFNFILTPISYAIIAPFWLIGITVPFLLLKYILKGIEIIATVLPKFLLFGTTGTVSLDNLPEMFFRFIIIALAFWFLLFFIVYLRYAFQDAETGIQSLKTAAKYSFMCWIYIMLIPAGLFVLYTFMDWFMQLIGLNSKEGVAEMLFRALKPNEAATNVWEQIIADNFILYYGSYSALGGWDAFFTVLLHALMGFIIGLGVLLAYFYAGLLIMQKVFDQVFLFIMSPVIATTSVLDGGKRMIQWRDMMIAKCLVIFAIILGSRLYINLLDVTIKNIGKLTGIAGGGNFFTNLPNIITIMLIAIGGAFAFSEFGNLLASFTGEGASLKEASSQTKTMIGAFAATGNAYRGAKNVASAVGKAKDKIIDSKNAKALSKDFSIGAGKNSNSVNFVNRLQMQKDRISAYFSGNKNRAQEIKTKLSYHKEYAKQQKELKKNDDLMNQRMNEIIKNKNLLRSERDSQINRLKNQWEASRGRIKKDFDKNINQLKKEFQKPNKNKNGNDE